MSIPSSSSESRVIISALGKLLLLRFNYLHKVKQDLCYSFMKANMPYIPKFALSFNISVSNFPTVWIAGSLKIFFLPYKSVIINSFSVA